MKKLFIALLLIICGALALLYRSDISAGEIEKKYADSTSRFMDIMGMRAHYRYEGDPTDSTPLVLIHGTSSSLHTWDSIVPSFRTNRRILRMDMPGFGLTGPTPDRVYSMERYHLFLDSLFDRLNIRQCIIGGNSLGGLIAWTYALHDSNRIKGLVLIDAAGYPKGKEEGNIGFRLAAMPGVGRVLSKFTPRILIRKSLEGSYGNPERINEALVDRYFDILLREGNREAMIDMFGSRRPAAHERISTIRKPTLIIWGDQDRLIDVSNAYRFQRDIPGSQLLVIPGSGHVPMEERPREVIGAVNHFLQDLSTPMHY
jgi:pimeloyl-ACP methyl ester carboxylesterase